MLNFFLSCCITYLPVEQLSLNWCAFVLRVRVTEIAWVNLTLPTAEECFWLATAQYDARSSSGRVIERRRRRRARCAGTILWDFEFLHRKLEQVELVETGVHLFISVTEVPWVLFFLFFLFIKNN
jgi:hypothetical protein